MTDIPYEKVVISQSMIEPNKIVAWDFFGGEDNIILMAEYSAPEKAEKAMQKLHDRYEYIWECANGFGVYHKIDTVVFRFPQDDEL